MNSEVAKIEAELNAGMTQLLATLPPHVNVEAFIQAAVHHIAAKRRGFQLWDPQSVDRASLLDAVHEAAAEGMMLDGNQAAIVAFKGQAKYMLIVGGMIKQIHNTGMCRNIIVDVAYEGEEFAWTRQPVEQIKHVPCPPSKRGELIAAYAVVEMKDGSVYREVMWADELADIQSSSRQQELYNGPWRNQMLKKAPLRRLFKRLPVATDKPSTSQVLVGKDLTEAIRADAEAEFGGWDEPAEDVREGHAPQAPETADRAKPGAGSDEPRTPATSHPPAPSAQGTRSPTRGAQVVAGVRGQGAPPAPSDDPFDGPLSDVGF